jgi:hypothetical protein
MDELWERNDIQFVRLLAEIRAVGLTSEQLKDLRASMDCTTDEICDILERAEDIFEGVKEHAPEVLPTCYVCGGGR